MKKIIFTTIAIITFSIVANAQTKPDTKFSKEDKAAWKAKQDQELNDAIKETGLTDDQANQIKRVLKDASKKSSELKKDTTLNEDAKATKKEEINTEKNDKLIQIMGDDKYKQWNAIRKRQKEQNMLPAPPPPAATPVNENNKPQ